MASRIPQRGVGVTARSVVVASIVLALMLAVVTARNFHREERLMETFLVEEGITLIRAFEAGARTSLMMLGSMDESPIASLVRETARAATVAYVRVYDERGELLASAGEADAPFGADLIREVLGSGEPLTRITLDHDGVGHLEVAKAFRPDLAGGAPPEDARKRWEQWCALGRTPADPGCRQAIFVGLHTEEFDDARREDVQQSLIIVGALVLVAVAGFSLLFLSHKVVAARTAVQDMEVYTRDVIESLPEGLVTLDGRHRVASMNSKAQELFGISEAETVGRPLGVLGGAAAYGGLLTKGEALTEFPMECVRPGGERVPAKITVSPLSSREGEQLGSVLIVHDQRPIRAMEAQVERAKRLAALGHMAAGIAHEIRNPLGTLRGFAQLLGQKTSGDDRRGEYVDLMVGEIDRLNRIISALLEFARPREPEWQAVSLRALLDRTAKLLGGEFEAQGVNLIVEAGPHAVTLTADPDLLTQVLLNLLQNALAATPPGGRVSLGGGERDSWVRIRVEDSGRGMSPEVRERMFDPFFTSQKRGTGLGLTAVHQIVEQHGGYLEVKSAEGRGTRVTVFLPRERQA